MFPSFAVDPASLSRCSLFCRSLPFFSSPDQPVDYGRSTSYPRHYFSVYPSGCLLCVFAGLFALTDRCLLFFACSISTFKGPQTSVRRGPTSLNTWDAWCELSHKHGISHVIKNPTDPSVSENGATISNVPATRRRASDVSKILLKTVALQRETKRALNTVVMMMAVVNSGREVERLCEQQQREMEQWMNGWMDMIFQGYNCGDQLQSGACYRSS